ncbi:hypothetical protein KMW28_10210 [Flammeovirga yaeyamensis]|uniref:DUF3828 domain-containing protein n=1 Tax=Flammeovirga yaeyamensis TaxID=367791 RepID=A0AAX1MXH1_9BACT|nr:hypothetical protein [Flammeovirga yaeyamensis]MBB3696474.1 hypothetical protein [Flammeovirga yaeyamensis]NMF35152.1 hypothetical protein [Flammeovirga yaeyamensis]QWG00028.1 hypothetical protein KMW28_10210 [Flammeovirga yaeyamensis]
MRYKFLLILSLLNFSINNAKSNTTISGNIKEINTTKFHYERIFYFSAHNNKLTDIAVKFINDYVSYRNSCNDWKEILNWIDNYPNVSVSFKNELYKIILETEKNEPEMGLDFDPIFDAQDFPDDRFKLFNYDKSTNYLTVESLSWKGFYITIKIKKIDNSWLVDGCGVINIPKSRQAKR